MSWEIFRKDEVICPCGEGHISRTIYNDDWNRFREQVNLECSICARNYYIESRDIGHYDKVITEYYVVRKDYPVYKSEYKEIKINNNISFEKKLIANFSKRDLNIAKQIYDETTTIKGLKGNCAKIAQMYKKHFGKSSHKKILCYITEAICKYDTIVYNKDYLDFMRKQEQNKKEDYWKEKKKNCILLMF